VHVFEACRRQRRHLDARHGPPSTVQFCCGFRFASFLIVMFEALPPMSSP